MANNRIQVKRTNVSGRTPNTSDPANTQYIAAGELALNMLDGILFTSNGSAVIEVGANNTSQNISTNNLTVGSALYVVANGNIGVGTSTPTHKLNVVGPSSFPYNIAALTDGTSRGITLNSSTNGYTNMRLFDAGGRNITITSQPNDLTTSDNYLAAIASGLGAGVSLSTAVNVDSQHITLRARGDIAFYTNLGSTALLERMRIAANGNIGIGISSPSDLLAVESQTSNVVARISAGSSASYSATLAMGTTTRDWSLVAGNAAASYSLSLNYVGTDAPVSNIFTALKGGNFGIGTSAPSSRLNVSGGQIRIQSSGTYSEPAVIAGVFAFDSVNGQLSISSRSNGGSTYTSFFTSDSGTGAERMRIAANGNIGIGTVSPAQKLHLIGTSGNILIRLDDAVNPRNNYIGVDNYEQVVLAANESNTIGATPYIKFRINASELVRILPSGNFGIGTTSPSEKLHVYGSTNIFLKAQSTGVGAAGLWLENSTGWYKWQMDSTRAFSLTDSAGPNRMFVANNGNIGLGDFAVSTPGANYAPKAKLDVAGSLSVGYALTDTFTTPSNSLVVSGNVGVGTSSPATKLHVRVGYSNTVVQALTLQNPYDGTDVGGSSLLFKNFYNNALISAYSSPFTGQGGTLQLQTYNSETVLNTGIVLSSGGNVGIGTTAPAGYLWAPAAGDNAQARLGQIIFNSSQVNGYTGSILWANWNPLTAAKNVAGWSYGLDLGRSGDFLAISRIPDGSTTASEFLRINSSGNVGIGTISPARKLDVYGSGQFSDASGIQTTIWSQAASGTGGVGTNNNYPFTVLSNGVERIRFLTNGDIGINQSSVTGVFGRTISATGPNGATFRFAGATVSGYVFASDGLGYVGITTETNHHLTLATNSTERVRVTSSGDVGIGITTPTAKLDVNGSGKFASNTANASIYINNNVEITTNSNNSTVSISNTIITSFSTANYRGGKFIIMGKRQNDSHMSEVLVTHNNLSAFYNEYGIVYTNDSLYTVSASVVSGNVQIVLTSSFDDMNYDIIENRFVHEQTLELDFTNNSYNLLT